MSNITTVGRQLRGYESFPKFDGYSKVVLQVTDDVEYVSGTDTGRVLTLQCPWGTQDMADRMLDKIRGITYQPFRAQGALLDPAVELGDGITANGVYGGVYSQRTTFGALHTADVEAPVEENLDHEYPYVPKQERSTKRTMKRLTSELRIQADLIAAEVAERKSETEAIQSKLTIQAGLIDAKVSKSGGVSSSFGWALDEKSWTLKSNGANVLVADRYGIEVTGKITATSGKLGGFDIQSDYLSYNNMRWGGTNTQGIYIGVQGIQLGKNFKVDAAGNLTAASGTFNGRVRAGSIDYGGSSGTLSGAALTAGSVSGGSSGAIRGSSISTFNTTGGINTSLGYADFANGAFQGWNHVGYIKATYGYFSTIVMGNYIYRPTTYKIKDGDGVVNYIHCLGRVGTA